MSADWTVDDSSVESWVLQRNKHHLEVLKYFKGRQDDLLITNFVREPDAAKSIASFLGSETNIKKPHAHINRNNRSKGLKHEEQIYRCLKRLGIDESEYSSDLLCLSLLNESDKKDLIGDTSFLIK